MKLFGLTTNISGSEQVESLQATVCQANYRRLSASSAYMGASSRWRVLLLAAAAVTVLLTVSALFGLETWGQVRTGLPEISHQAS